MCVTEQSEELGTWCMYVRDGKYTVLWDDDDDDDNNNNNNNNNIY
jgi:hypothetical protein